MLNSTTTIAPRALRLFGVVLVAGGAALTVASRGTPTVAALWWPVALVIAGVVVLVATRARYGLVSLRAPKKPGRSTGSRG